MVNKLEIIKIKILTDYESFYYFFINNYYKIFTIKKRFIILEYLFKIKNNRNFLALYKHKLQAFIVDKKFRQFTN